MSSIISISKSYLFGFTAIWLTQTIVLLNVNGIIPDKITYIVRLFPLLMLILLPNKRKKQTNVFVIILSILLLFRINYHLVVNPTEGTSIYIYLFRFLSSIMIPLIIFYFKEVVLIKFYKGFIHSVFLFVVLGFIFYRDILFMPYRNIMHFSNYSSDELISALSFGYSGLFLLIDSITSNRKWFVNLILFLLSFYLIIWSGTRSITIAAVIILFMKYSWRILFSFLLVLFVPKSLTTFVSGLTDRFILLYNELLDGGDVGSFRKSGYEQVLDGIDIGNIWLGYGIELNSTNYVAHSIIFETLHMTGIIGLVILLLSLLVKSTRTYWLPIRFLFVGRLITGFFSNSILDPLTWYFLFFLRQSKQK